MTRGRRKAIQKRGRTLLSVNQFLPVLAYAPLYFDRRRFFGVLFLCVFPQRRLVNVANFRCDGGRASILSFLFFASTLLSQTFESYPKGGSARESSVKYFGSVNRWKVHPFPFRGTDLPFSLRFSTSPKFRGLNRETPWPGNTKRMRAKLTLSNE